MKSPSSDPIEFSLTEVGDNQVTIGSKKKTYDPDVEPSSDEESDAVPTTIAVVDTARFNPPETTAEVYICMSDEEDPLVDSQATIIYTQEDTTSKGIGPSRIPLQQKQLKQTTLSKGSLSQSTSNPTVSLPRLSLAPDFRLSQGNAKSMKKMGNT